MVMGSLLIISGCFMYLLLKPPVPHNSSIQQEVVFPKNPSLDLEINLNVPNRAIF